MRGASADTVNEPLFRDEIRVSKLRTMLDARRPSRLKPGETPREQQNSPEPSPAPGPGATSRIAKRERPPLYLSTQAPTTVVGISDLAAVSRSGRLVTYALGSCVGVVGYDEQSGVAGLLHVLLPQSGADLERAALRPATYADTGIPALVLAMRRLGADPQTSRFRLAGGASMLKSSATLQVGRRNVLAVRKAIWKAGLLVQGEAVGGTQPRTMTVDSQTGLVTISSPGRPELAL